MQDHIGRYVHGGGAAVALIRATNTVREIVCRQHGLRQEPARVLAEAILSALLQATRLKGQGQLLWQVVNEGVFRQLRVDAMGQGLVRAMVTPGVHEALADWNRIDPLLGPGRLAISRQLKDEPKAYQSVLAVEPNGGIQAWTNAFLRQSDQVRARVHLQVDLDADGEIERAAGCYGEALPGHEIGDLPTGLQALLLSEQPVVLPSQQDDAALLADLCRVDDLQHLRDFPVGFFCPCSRERYIGTLRGFGREQVLELQDGQGVIRTRCDFCGANYEIPVDEVI